MLNKFYYQNNFGEKLYFGKDGLFASYNDLRDYQWNYELNNNVIGKFSRGAVVKSLPCIFLSDNARTTKALRNKAYSIIEKDVISGKKGKLYLNGYFMECYIYGMSNSDYLENQRYLKTTMYVCSDKPSWKRENSYTFEVLNNSKSENGFTFPFEFPIGFQVTPIVSNTLINKSKFVSDFNLVIFGACKNPHIIIGDYEYSFNCELKKNEYLEINSNDKTIYKYGMNNLKENLFNCRNKRQSVFAKIPIGNKIVTWNNEFKFSITVIEEYSEPEWICETNIFQIGDGNKNGLYYCR